MWTTRSGGSGKDAGVGGRAASCAVCFLLASPAHAEPLWADADRVPFERISFAFSGYAGLSKERDVDSLPVYLRVIGTAFPVSMALARPGSCKVGSRHIPDADVELVKDGQVLRKDGNATIASGDAFPLRLRFAAAAGIGDAAGAVSCERAGRLRFSF